MARQQSHRDLVRRMRQWLVSGVKRIVEVIVNYTRGIREPEHQRSRRPWKRDTGTWLPINPRQDSSWLQDALAIGAVLAFQWDARSGTSQRSANAADILGFGPHQALTAERFLARIDPEDRKLLKARMRDVRPNSPAYCISFRFARPDGRHIWLEETARGEFDATGRLVRLRGLTRDISLRRRLEEHQAMLLTEFDHRVKNVLSRVAAVVSATRGQVGSVEEYAKALEGRIASLVNAHELIGQNHTVSLSELVRRQLAPYAVAGNSALTGPDLALSSEAAEAIALVMHELVTNAAKYGALSVVGGQVMVKWEQGLGGALSINWREVGGPTITDQNDSGHGLSLIRDLIPHELAGKVDFQYATRGVECTITIPAEHLRTVDLGPRGSGSR
jgi:two-component sensor histidine kinase